MDSKLTKENFEAFVKALDEAEQSLDRLTNVAHLAMGSVAARRLVDGETIIQAKKVILQSRLSANTELDDWDQMQTMTITEKMRHVRSQFIKQLKIMTGSE